MAVSKLLTRNDLQNVLAHINLGDDAHREITQAEFDQLSDEDKNDGTIYFITDGISQNIFLDDNVPVGAIMPYGGATDPAYWLICDGRAISRTAYAELFAVIGTTYGTGDGETTFNIPDLRGNVAVGASATYDLGDSGGEATHTLNQNEIPNYDIGFMPTAVPGSHGQWTNGGIIAAGGATGASQGKSGTIYIAGTANTNAQYGWTVRTNGGGQAANNMQPYIVTNYIIKTSSAASKQQTQLDFTYPIGSYYETTDSTFDPNIKWGGVWSLSTSSVIPDFKSQIISDIIVPGTNANIENVMIECKNGIAQLFISWKNTVAISAIADGNISNIIIGTLKPNLRPPFAASGTSYGDNGGPAFYIVDSAGVVIMGGIGGTGNTRTVAAGTSWQACITYIIKDSDLTLYKWYRIA